jgi:hypothetical protein
MLQSSARLSDPFANCPPGCFGAMLEGLTRCFCAMLNGSACRFCAMLDRSSGPFEWTLISLRLTNRERHGECQCQNQN